MSWGGVGKGSRRAWGRDWGGVGEGVEGGLGRVGEGLAFCTSKTLFEKAR